MAITHLPHRILTYLQSKEGASSQLWTHWRSPISQNSPRTTNGALQTFKRPDLDAVYTFDLHIAQDRGLTFYETGSFAMILYDTMLSEVMVKSRECSPISSKKTIRRLKFSPIQDHCQSEKLHVQKIFLQTEDAAQPQMETAWRDLVHDNKAPAQSS